MIKKPQIQTRDFAEFVGVLLGDGCIGKYICKAGKDIKIQYRVKVTGDAEEDLQYFRYSLIPLMKKLFGKEPLLRFKKNERSMDLLYFGKEIYNFLTNDVGLKPSPKKNNAVVPNFIFEKNLEKHFLRGLFDTDGCLVFDKQNKDVHYYPRLEIKMMPSPMVNQVLQMLEKLGFRYITSKQPNDGLRIQINGKQMLEKWVASVKFNNQKHITKYELWKKLGYYMPNTTIKQRISILRQ